MKTGKSRLRIPQYVLGEKKLHVMGKKEQRKEIRSKARITTGNNKLNSYALGSIPCISHHFSFLELFPDRVESCGHPVDRSGLSQLKCNTDLVAGVLEILK